MKTPPDLGRRRLLLQAALAGATGLALGRAARSQPRVLEITARRFAFEPAEVTLRAGEPSVLAIRSIDFVHGFHIPELGKRADLLPGRVTRIELPALAPGTIAFLCDNFCGDGHEDMGGRLVVAP